MNEKNSIWESAGKAGLVLGGISILYMFVNMLLLKFAADGGFLLGLFRFLLWAAKLVGCIYLIRFFMSRYSDANPEADHSRVFTFGMLVAFLSALLYAGVSLAYTSFFAPDMYADAFAALEDNPMMDSNALAALDEIAPKMPAIAFFTNLVYCFLFGTIVSAIFARKIVPERPFSD